MTSSGRREQAMLAVALAAAYAATVLGAWAGAAGLALIAAVATLGCEYVVWRRAGQLYGLLRKLGLGAPSRYLVRDLSIGVLMVRLLSPSAGQVIALATVIATLHLVAEIKSALNTFLKTHRELPIVTRNIDLSALRIPDPPPAWATGLTKDRLINLNALLIPAAVVGISDDTLTPVVITGLITTVTAVVVMVTLVPAAVRVHVFPADEQIKTEIARQVDAYRPTVVLYHTGTPSSLYQVEMWLQTVAAVGEPTLVVLRGRSSMAQMAPTELPVVCIPHSVTMMNFPLPTARVALYPANAGPNIHLLRDPVMRHVFIGHGDSDKVASVNPFAKVYDEVWVAGRAGRERYLRAEVGVRDEDIVEVGRPQLRDITIGPRPRAEGEPFTVLYAPTWEGWGDDPYHTSLTHMGRQIITQLLAATDPVRVVYRPHPLTGTQSPAAAAAHRDIIAMLHGAGARIAAAARDRPKSRTQRLLAGARGLASGVRSWLVEPVAAEEEAVAARDQKPASAVAARKREPGLAPTVDLGAGHVVAQGSVPSLHDCFNHADLLISDVSSVVADFVQSQKPYVVANPQGLAEAEFRQLYPTAGAAYLLSADCAELGQVLSLTRERNDPMVTARRDLASYLLGPAEPEPLVRFTAEINRIVAGRLPDGSPGRGVRADPMTRESAATPVRPEPRAVSRPV